MAESWAGRARQSAGGSLPHDVPNGRPQRAESPEETAAGETRGRSVRKGTWTNAAGLTPAPNALWHDLHWCQMLYGFLQRFRPLQTGLFCLVVLNSRIFFCIPGESCGRSYRSLLLCSSVECIYLVSNVLCSWSQLEHSSKYQSVFGWMADWQLVAHSQNINTSLILETTCK